MKFIYMYCTGYLGTDKRYISIYIKCTNFYFDGHGSWPPIYCIFSLQFFQSLSNG